MENVKIIEIKKSVFENNDRAADELRGELKTKGVFLLTRQSLQTIYQRKTQVRQKLSLAEAEDITTAIV